MTRPPLVPGDTAPLREALRGLRFLLRRGGATVADTLAIEALPTPAASLASRVLREAEGIARSVESVAAKAARTVLGGQDSPSLSLDELVARPTAEAEFGQAIYLALSVVLRRLGAADFFVSEMAARSAFAVWRDDRLAGALSFHAADLTLRLLEARVIRGAVADKAGRIQAQDVDAVAVFAVLLWLQATRSDSENEAALDAAADIALARAPEVTDTVRSGDMARIAALYQRYVDHV